MVIIVITKSQEFPSSLGSDRYFFGRFSTALSLIALSATRHPCLAWRDSPSRLDVARRMVPTGKNNALEIQMTERGGRAAIYQIKAVVQSNTRPCRQWKRQFIFNIKRERGRDLPGCSDKKNMATALPSHLSLDLRIYNRKYLMVRESYGCR